jgi:hypothetical protein
MTGEPRRRPRRRLLRGVARALLVSAAVLVAGLALLVRNLDSAPVKRRLLALLRARAGLELDYGSTRLELGSGFHLTDVRVMQPEELRGVEPELLRIGALDVEWSLGDRTHTPVKLSVRGVELTLAKNDAGLSSLDALTGEAPTTATAPAPAPAKPFALSSFARGVLERPPFLEQIALDDVAVNFVAGHDGLPYDRLRVAGLRVHAASRPDGAASHQLVLELGTEAQPLDVTIASEHANGKGQADAKLHATVALTAQSARATVDVALERQTIAPLPRIARVVRLDAGARFQPERRATRVEVATLDLADGAWTSELELDLPDAGAPVVHHASGSVDAARLVALAQPLLAAASEDARVKLGEGKLRWTASGLDLSGPRLADDGKLQLDGALAGLRLETGGRELRVERGRMALHGAPHKHGVTRFTLEVPLGDVRAGDAASRVEAAQLEVGLDASVPEHGPLDVLVTGRFGGAKAAAPAQSLTARDGHASIHLAELHVDAEAPLASRAALTVEGGLGALELAHGKLRLAADDVGWNLRAHLTGKAPYAVEGEVPIGKLRLFGARGPLLPPTGAKLTLHAAELKPDAERPARSTGTFKVDADLGSLTATVGGWKRPDSAEVELSVDASSLALLKFVAPDENAVPWERMTLSWRGSATVEKLAETPRLKQQSTIKLGRPGFGDAVSAAGVEVALSSNGTLTREDATLDVKLAALTLEHRKLGDGHGALAATVDLARPSLTVRFDGQGAAGPEGTLALDASFDARKRALRYRVDGELRRLGLIAPFVAEVPQLGRVDLGALGVKLHGEGTLLGVIERFVGARPVLAPRPLATLAGDDAVELHLDHVHYAVEDSDVELEAPQLTVRSTVSGEGDKRRAHTEIEVARAQLTLGEHTLGFDKLDDTLDLTLAGDPMAGDLDLEHHVALRALKQDYAPSYPVGAVTVATRVERRGTTVRLTELQVENGAGGTHVGLAGAIDLNLRELASRRALSAEGTITQNLEKLSNAPSLASGRGKLALALRVESGDLALYHAVASLRVEGASLELPGRHLRVTSLDCEVPVAEDFVVGKKGVELVGRAADNAYPQMRFADQHPFLSGRSFLSMAMLETPSFVVGPLAGNLRVDRNLVSLDQLEMSARGGRVTGQCALDWRGAASTMRMRVRASHVEASHGGVKEPFDGNAALTVSLKQRTIDGRAEIIHIGRNHLLDLLDLADPHRTDVAMNRVRKALSLGYPDRARLLFDRGFASLLVEFGGLARLVRVDEVRGIPMGPIIDKYLGPLIRAEGEK